MWRSTAGSRPRPLFAVDSSWGSDLFYYGRLAGHEPRVRAVLAACDSYIADCERDIGLAHELGFETEVLGVTVASAGFDLESMRRLRQSGPVSARTAIAVKGLHTDAWVARGVSSRCRRSISAPTSLQASRSTSIPRARTFATRRSTSRGSPASDVRVMAPSVEVPYTRVISLMGRARVAIAVNISDGTPTTLLQAMIMGAFPIQSDTVSTREWIVDGRNACSSTLEDPRPSPKPSGARSRTRLSSNPPPS